MVEYSGADDEANRGGGSGQCVRCAGFDGSYFSGAALIVVKGDRTGKMQILIKKTSMTYLILNTSRPPFNGVCELFQRNSCR